MGRGMAWAILIAAVLVTVFPFYWMLRTALTPSADLFSDAGSLWPRHPTLINFERVLGMTSPEEARAMRRLRRADQLPLVHAELGHLQRGDRDRADLLLRDGHYAFARLRFPGRDLIFGVLVAALMVPPIFTLLPNFALVKNLGLMNTFAGLVAPSVLMTPFAVFFLRQFFLSIPKEVEEAAVLDGVNRWGAFWRIIVPMSRGPLITIGLTTTVWAWKDFLWPLLVGRAEDTRVLTVALGVFLQQSPNTQPDWTGLMVSSTLSVLPVLILLIFLGKRLVQSLNFTGIK